MSCAQFFRKRGTAPAVEGAGGTEAGRVPLNLARTTKAFCSGIANAIEFCCARNASGAASAVSDEPQSSEQLQFWQLPQLSVAEEQGTIICGHARASAAINANNRCTYLVSASSGELQAPHRPRLANQPTKPRNVAPAPAPSRRMALPDGVPVKTREISELNEFKAWNPKIRSTIPHTTSPIDSALFILIGYSSRRNATL